MSKNIAACKLVEEIKKESSKWLKTQEKDLAAFCWQVGNGTFSISPSAVAATERYILRQESIFVMHIAGRLWSGSRGDGTLATCEFAQGAQGPRFVVGRMSWLTVRMSF
jgi:hypothetical protein